MIPRVALVGRSNVGKSTLFNRLTRTYSALVANHPGLTHDRNYGYAETEGHKFICIDTGGIDGIKNSMEARVVEQQSLLAIKESDMILFIVDARAGLIPIEFVIAKHLRSCNKLIFLIVNKIDGIDVSQAIIDFWSLGLGKIYPIAALHGRGITNLLKDMVSFFQRKKDFPKDVNEDFINWKKLEKHKKNQNLAFKDYFNLQSLPIKLAIVGRPNVGKSTLINRLVGKERVVVCSKPGTTRDSIYIPIQCNDHKYILIDTAGVRKKNKIINVVEKFSVIKTLQAIEDANVVLLMIDAYESISDQDLSLLNFILKSGRPVVIIINKWDVLLGSKEKNRIKETISYRLNFIKFARIHFISALYENRLDSLFESAQEAYDHSVRRQSATILTRIMNMAVENYQPPLIQGRRVKLKYVHAGGYNPPILVIHGNQVKNLPNSYKRYLINYFQKSLEVVGTPIFLQFKEGKNPFAREQSVS